MSKVSMLWFRRLFVFLLVVSANVLWAASTITTTVVTASPNPVLTGQSVQFTAKVTGTAPSGVVDFYDQNDIKLGQASVVNGSAVLTTSFPSWNVKRIFAFYRGDVQNNPSTSPSYPFLIRDVAGATLTVSPNPVAPNQPFTLKTVGLTADVKDVYFYSTAGIYYGRATPIGGAASLTFAGVASGPADIYADYNTGSILKTTSNIALLSVNNSPTTLTDSKISVFASPDPVPLDQMVTLTAQVLGKTPNGTVSFRNGISTFGTATLSGGVASFSFNNTANLGYTGSYAAIYSGDSQNTAAFDYSPRYLTIPTITLGSDLNSVATNQNFTLTATARGYNVSGTIAFMDGATVLQTIPLTRIESSTATATLTTSFSSASTHKITAVYSGDYTFTSKVSNALNITSIGTKATSSVALTTNANPVIAGQTVFLTTTVTGNNPTGTVTFMDGTTTLGTATLNSGTATYSTINLATGAHNLSAVYSGDTANSGSTSTQVSLTVKPKVSSTTTFSVSPNPVISGQLVTLLAKVTGSNPTGTVTFKDGTTSIGRANVSNGTASFSMSTLTEGTHNLTASYDGDSLTAASTSAALDLVVKPKANTTTTVYSSHGQAILGDLVTITVAITGNKPTGDVTIMDGTAALGKVTIKPGASGIDFAISTLPIGTHTITAVYSGDGFNLGSTSAAAPVSLIVKPKTTTTLVLVANSNPIMVGQNVTLTATVSGGVPSGTINFMDGTTSLATVWLSSSGSAVFASSALASGKHSISAIYDGDGSHLGSKATLSLVVTPKTTTTTTLTLSPNPSLSGQLVSISATVNGSSPTGSVAFMDGTTLLGSVPINAGKAVLSSSTLAIGAHSISAIYPGDGGNERSTSATATLTVNDAVTTLSNYVVYGADINQDGCTDYLVRTKDGAAPVPIFTLVSSAGCQYTLTQPVPQAQSSSTAWVAAPYQLLIGDVRGDGNGSLLLVPTDKTSANVFNVARGTDRKTFSLLQTIAVSKLTADPTSVTMSLSKVDADNLTDLEVTSSNGLLNVFVANTDGQLALDGSANRAASATLVWGRFITQVAAANVDASLKYVGNDSQASVRASMTQPDSNLPAFAASIKQFGILEEEQAGQVQAAVVFSSAGQDETFIVRLTKEEDGIWRIVSM